MDTLHVELQCIFSCFISSESVMQLSNFIPSPSLHNEGGGWVSLRQAKRTNHLLSWRCVFAVLSVNVLNLRDLKFSRWCWNAMGWHLLSLHRSIIWAGDILSGIWAVGFLYWE